MQDIHIYFVYLNKKYCYASVNNADFCFINLLSEAFITIKYVKAHRTIYISVETNRTTNKCNVLPNIIPFLNKNIYGKRYEIKAKIVGITELISNLIFTLQLFNIISEIKSPTRYDAVLPIGTPR